MSRPDLPDGLIAYGPDANCTLAICPVTASVYEYRPDLGANSAFIALFGIAGIIHLVLGLRRRTWWFTICVLLGVIDEMIGYGGRVMLYKNPFNFNAFIMQIGMPNFMVDVYHILNELQSPSPSVQSFTLLPST